MIVLTLQFKIFNNASIVMLVFHVSIAIRHGRWFTS